MSKYLRTKIIHCSIHNSSIWSNEMSDDNNLHRPCRHQNRFGFYGPTLSFSGQKVHGVQIAGGVDHESTVASRRVKGSQWI